MWHPGDEGAHSACRPGCWASNLLLSGCWASMGTVSAMGEHCGTLMPSGGWQNRGPVLCPGVHTEDTGQVPSGYGVWKYRHLPDPGDRGLWVSLRVPYRSLAGPNLTSKVTSPHNREDQFVPSRGGPGTGHTHPSGTRAQPLPPQPGQIIPKAQRGSHVSRQYSGGMDSGAHAPTCIGAGRPQAT